MHPMIELFENMFAMDYKYDELSETKLLIIKTLLTHALENKINIDLDRESAFAYFEKDMHLGNLLYKFCTGKNLTEDKAPAILEIMELFIENGAQIKNECSTIPTLFDHVTHPRIFDKLLERSDFSEYKLLYAEYHTLIYRDAYHAIKITDTSTKEELDKKHCLEWKIKLLSNYLDKQLEKGVVNSGPINAANENRNLEDNKPTSHVDRVLQERANLNYKVQAPSRP